jgi:DNA-binding NarL/FixJ family response regulator
MGQGGHSVNTAGSLVTQVSGIWWFRIMAERFRVRRFTARESEILAHIARGSTNKEIARSLGISERTVKTHLERLFLRRGLHSRSEATADWITSQIEAGAGKQRIDRVLF